MLFSCILYTYFRLSKRVEVMMFIPIQPSKRPKGQGAKGAPNMKKIQFFLVLMSMFVLSACTQVTEFFGGGTTASSATVPATVTPKPTAATASVTCKGGDTQTAKAVGENAKAIASCGTQKTTAAKKTASVKSGVDEVRKQAHERADQKVEMSVKTHFAPSSIPRFPEEGKVYWDAGGNTFERHQGGSRECKFYVNGELVKRQFVQHPDPKKSKEQCDLLAAEFIAGLTPTTPEKVKSVVIDAGLTPIIPEKAPSTAVFAPDTKTTPAPAVSSVEKNHTCELKFNGAVVETTKTIDDPACKAWTQAKAREKGWIAK